MRKLSIARRNDEAAVRRVQPAETQQVPVIFQDVDFVIPFVEAQHPSGHPVLDGDGRHNLRRDDAVIGRLPRRHMERSDSREIALVSQPYRAHGCVKRET